ncbi:hypothetical protein [Mycobacterium paraterrae]|uniref:Uncharacterized protein n=1 Tax=Mycobacterium paraterrae TaxID=577492 RepID=A0ABY3VQJ5_9MYCO|nr:hypothetical protein [Mycobacterium paraterrae]UMB71714.1 hypothetical protein MKK62_11095 [Mycobacterium paraterrae]
MTTMHPAQRGEEESRNQLGVTTMHPAQRGEVRVPPSRAAAVGESRKACGGQMNAAQATV